MTVAELIEQLQKLPMDLEVITVHGSSGDSNPVGSPHVRTIHGGECCGPLCDMEVGTKYVELYIGN